MKPSSTIFKSSALGLLLLAIFLQSNWAQDNCSPAHKWSGVNAAVAFKYGWWEFYDLAGPPSPKPKIYRHRQATMNNNYTLPFSCTADSGSNAGNNWNSGHIDGHYEFHLSIDQTLEVSEDDGSYTTHSHTGSYNDDESLTGQRTHDVGCGGGYPYCVWYTNYVSTFTETAGSITDNSTSAVLDYKFDTSLRDELNEDITSSNDPNYHVGHYYNLETAPSFIRYGGELMPTTGSTETINSKTSASYSLITHLGTPQTAYCPDAAADETDTTTISLSTEFTTSRMYNIAVERADVGVTSGWWEDDDMMSARTIIADYELACLVRPLWFYFEFDSPANTMNTLSWTELFITENGVQAVPCYTNIFCATAGTFYTTTYKIIPPMQNCIVLVLDYKVCPWNNGSGGVTGGGTGGTCSASGSLASVVGSRSAGSCCGASNNSSQSLGGPGAGPNGLDVEIALGNTSYG
jgi:hypothetical protein